MRGKGQRDGHGEKRFVHEKEKENGEERIGTREWVKREVTEERHGGAEEKPTITRCVGQRKRRGGENTTKVRGATGTACVSDGRQINRHPSHAQHGSGSTTRSRRKSEPRAPRW